MGIDNIGKEHQVYIEELLEKLDGTPEGAFEVAKTLQTIYISITNEMEDGKSMIENEGVLQNAIKLYKIAYEGGIKYASFDIAKCSFVLGNTGSIEYADEAIEWCTIAKNSGILDAEDRKLVDELLSESVKLKQDLNQYINNKKQCQKKPMVVNNRHNIHN